MKVSKLVHPEIILGTRGNQHLIDAYKSFLKDILFHPGKGYSVANKTWEYFDPNLREHLMMTWKFKKEQAQVYYVPKEFTQALGKLDREVPVDLLPKRWFGYIAFGEGAIFDESEEVQGAYCYIGPGEETCIHPEEYGKTVLWISYVCRDSLGESRDRVVIVKRPEGYQVTNFLTVCRLLTELLPEKVERLMNSVPTQDHLSPDYPKPDAGQGSRELVYRTLVNLVLYINSIEPDLIKAPPTNHLSHGQRAKRREAGKPLNECTVPVTLVSWNYQKPPQYRVGSTWVDTYQRWQRCGEGFKSVRLIWVTPHERKYKKEGPDADGKETSPE